MRPLDAVVLAQWCGFHSSWLVGARLQKIQHPTPRELVFYLRLPNKAAAETLGTALYVAIHKPYPALFLGHSAQVEALVEPTFTKATNWCLQLRKHLVGGRIVGLETLPGERVVQLAVENTNALGERERWYLMLELMGRHSNVLLVEANTQAIVGAAHHVSETMSQHRQIATGMRYVPPPVPPDKLWLGQIAPEELAEHLKTLSAKALSHLYTGAGRHTWQDAQCWDTECREAHSSTEQENSWLLAAQTIQYAAEEQPVLRWETISPEQFKLRPLSKSIFREEFSTIQQAKTYNTGIFQLLAARQMAESRRQLLAIVGRQQEKLVQRQAACLSDMENETKATQAQHWGDLLSTYAAQQATAASPEDEMCLLADWQTGQEVKIPVDETLSWQANAQRYYKQARQIRQRAQYEQQQAEIWQQQAQTLAQFAWAIQQAEELSEFRQLAEAMTALGWVKSSKHAVQKTVKPTEKTDSSSQIAGLLVLTASDGQTPIYVGRQGQANQALLSQLSRQEDWWCHAKAYPGAHVVIRHPDPPETVLLDGLHLAAHFSGGAGSGKLPIVYTQRRFVRKIPNSYPGHVTYKQEVEALITADSARIEALLTSGGKSSISPLDDG